MNNNDIIVHAQASIVVSKNNHNRDSNVLGKL